MPKDKPEKKKLMVVEEVEDTASAIEDETPKEEVITDEKIIEEAPEAVESHDHNHDEDHHHDHNHNEDNHEHVDHDEHVDTVEEEKPEPAEEVEIEYNEKSQGLMWIIVLTALLVGALAGGFITYFSGLSRLDAPLASSTPVATVEPSTLVTPTPAAQSGVKREDLKVQVLNGSGVSGAAGKAKADLEKLGYKDVQTGNAPTSDVAETEVSVLKAKENYLDLVKKDLEDSSYTLSSTTKTLPTSSKFDVVITLGKK